MIWGKTGKACGTAGGMDNGVFQLIQWVDLRRSLSNLEDILKNMMLLMCAFCLPASLSASEFQGAGQAEAKVFRIMCAAQELSV
jgi:hypothetical protein